MTAWRRYWQVKTKERQKQKKKWRSTLSSREREKKNKQQPCFSHQIYHSSSYTDWSVVVSIVTTLISQLENGSHLAFSANALISLYTLQSRAGRRNAVGALEPKILYLSYVGSLLELNMPHLLRHGWRERYATLCHSVRAIWDQFSSTSCRLSACHQV